MLLPAHCVLKKRLGNCLQWYLLFKVQFFWHQSNFRLDSWCRDNLWGSKMHPSLLPGAQGLQRILVKDEFKNGKWDKCKERRKLVWPAFCPAPLIQWRLVEGDGRLGTGGTGDGKERQTTNAFHLTSNRSSPKTWRRLKTNQNNLATLILRKIKVPSKPNLLFYY